MFVVLTLLGTLLLPAALGDLKFTLLHHNDLHSHLSPSTKWGGNCESKNFGSCYGGYPRLISKIKEIRNSGSNVIHVNAGDMYQGTFWYTMFKWEPLGVLTPMLDLDAMTLGNHDFDDGVNGLLPYLDKISVPILACNLDLSKEPVLQEKVQPSLILDIDGKKIGIIGYVTPDTRFLSKTGKTVFAQEEPAIQAEIDKLKAQGVDIFIGLGHSGYGRDKEIASSVPDLDLVVGGHTHSFLYPEGQTPKMDDPEGPYPTVIQHKDGRKTLVVQAKSFSKYIGKLDLTFNDAGEVVGYEGAPILLDSSIPDDPEAAKYLNTMLPQMEEKTQMIVGSTNVDLNGDRSVCRQAECNMGNLVADSILRKLILPREYQWSSITGAVINGGGVRASLNRGNITFGDVKTVMPFSNDIVYMTVRGDTFLWMFEHSVKFIDPKVPAADLPGAFLQVAGIKVSYDLCKEPGQRVVRLQILCSDCMMPDYEDVKPEGEYTIGLLEYLYHGGDGFKRLEPEALYYQPLGAMDADILIEHLKRESPAMPSVEGRITFIRDGKNCE